MLVRAGCLVLHCLRHESDGASKRHFDQRLNLPESEVLSRLDFSNTAVQWYFGFGRDGLVRKAGRTPDRVF